MNPISKRRDLRLALATTAIFVGAAGAALAATTLTSSEPTVIQACKLNLIGTLRVVRAAGDCNPKLETPLGWNIEGPSGLVGPQGPRGEKGEAGATGPVGPVSLATLGGSPCTDHIGRAGTILVTTTTNDEVLLRCTVTGAGGGSSGDQPPVHLVALSFQRYDATHYTVTVTLSGPASQDTTVALSSSDTTSVVVPTTTTLSAGQTAGAVDGGTTIFSAAGAEITATLAGESIHATLTPN